MSKISNSIDLAKSSLGVLRTDKELAAIPLASSITCGIVALAFAGLAYLSVDHVSHPAAGQSDWQVTPLTWSIGVIAIFVIGMVAQFFAAVLIAGANERLEGGSPTLKSAFAKASSRTGSILGWSVVNATVGMILSSIRQRAGFLGDIAAGLFGAAWTVITWLALPIIVIEGLGPIAAIKRSVEMLKQTWGENIIAQIGLGALGFVVMLPGMVVFGALAWLVPLLGIPLLGIYFAVVASIMSALGSIYRTALYRFAAGLPTGGAFQEEALAGAFRQKGGMASKLLH
ncbi:MAG TPA: DUF6159 family protein [Acidimicrobiales bacterium]